MRVLVTRPEPAASRTAARLRALGHDAVVAPLLLPHALAWAQPPGDWQAVAFTSALGAAFGGPGLAALTHLPAYAVGAATADAARAAGFGNVRAGDGDAAALFARAAADGITRLLHLAGADRTPATSPAALAVTVVETYAADLAAALPAADWDLALVYSPRTARQFAALADRRSGVGALSPAVAAALGPGWPRLAVATLPSEDALFAACGLTG